MPSRDKRLPLDTWNQSGLQENVFGYQFSTFDSTTDYSQRIQSDDVQRNREAADKAVDYKFYNTGGITAELHGRTAETANIGSAIRQIP